MRPSAWGWVLVAAIAVAALLPWQSEDGHAPTDLGDGVGADRADPPAPDGPGLAVETGRSAEHVERRGKGTLELEGRVVRPDDTPCPEWRVRAVCYPRGGPAFRMAERVELKIATPTWGLRSTAISFTDADGRFVLRGLDPTSTYLIVPDAQAPECAATFWLHRGEGELPADLKLVVSEGVPVRVRVVDAQGRGLQAWVGLHVESDSERAPKHLDSWYTPPLETDADGALQFPSVPNCPLHANVIVPRRSSVNCLRFDVPDAGEVTLQVGAAEGAVLVGRVTSPGGEALPNARVIVSLAPADEGAGFVRRAELTNGSGEYQFLSLPAGKLDLLAVSVGGRHHEAREHRALRLQAGERAQADVRLEPARRIVGRAFSEVGRPLAGIFVRALTTDDWPMVLASATSDATGAFVLADVGSGDRLLQAAGGGWHVRKPESDEGGVRDLMLRYAGGGIRVVCPPDKTELEVRIELERGPEIRGRTVDATGQAVSGARIVAIGDALTLAKGMGFPALIPAAVSGADGAFEVLEFPPGSRGRISAVLGKLRSNAVEVGTGVSSEPITLVLREALSVSGRVLGGRDEPLEGIALKIEALALSAETDAQGAFRFGALPPGSHRIVYEPVWGSPSDERHVEVDVRSPDHPPLTLHWPASGEVQGIVVDDQDQAVPSVFVELRPVGASPHGGSRGWAGQDGKFRVRWLGDGAHFIKVDGEPLEQTVEAGATDVRLVVQRGASVELRGRVLAADGVPLRAGRVRAWDPDSEAKTALESESIHGGRFEMVLDAPPERIRLTIEDAVRGNGLRDLRPVTEVPDVDPRGEPVQIRIEDGLELSGRVVGPQGRGVPGAAVVLTRAEGGGRTTFALGRDALTRVVTGQDGGFRFRGLGKGEVRLDVHPSQNHAGMSDVSAQAGEDDILVRVPVGLEARLSVQGPDGAPVSGALVSVFPGGAYWSSLAEARHVGHTDAAGEVVLRGVEPGTAHLEVGPPDGAERTWPHPVLRLMDVDVPAIGTVTLPKGHRIEVELRGHDGKPLADRTVDVALRGKLRHHDTRLVGAPESPHVYRSPLLVAGTYRLDVRAEGAHLGVSDQRVDVPGPRVQVRLQRASALRGRVLTSGARRWHIVFTGAHNGREVSGLDFVYFGSPFEILLPGPARGALYGSADDSDEYVLVERVEAPREDLALRPRTGLRIAGRVVDWPAGEEGEVEGKHESGATLEADVKADGTFLLRAVPPGRLDLRAWFPDYSRAAQGEAEAGATGVELRAK